MLNGPYYSTSELTLLFMMTRTLDLLEFEWNYLSMYQTLKITIHKSIEEHHLDLRGLSYLKYEIQ